MMSPERRIRLPVFIKIGRMHPAAIFAVEKDDHAFADVDEEADCATASTLQQLVQSYFSP